MSIAQNERFDEKKPHWILSEASLLLRGGVTSFRQPRLGLPNRATVGVTFV